MIAALPSPDVIYLSQARIVADGRTDERSLLQPLFDRASNGQPIEIVNDLAGALVTSGNDVWPNTTIRTLNGATWRLAMGSSRAILRNRHPLASWPLDAKRQDGVVSKGPTLPDDAHPMTDEGHGDFNITLIGGVYDGNRRSGGWTNNGRTPTSADPKLGRDNLLVSTLQFYGVKHLSMQDVRVYDSPSLAIHLANVSDVAVTDCGIEFPAVVYGSNTDGFHINGPADNIAISNMHLRQTGDDAITLSADDSMEATTEGGQPMYFGMSAGWGPISHVRMRGIYLDRCSSGIRPLSATQRIDDVIIADVQGSCLGAAVLIDKYLFNHDRGNIGSFTLENIQVGVLGLHYDGAAPGFTAPSAGQACDLFYCNTDIENLTLRNVVHSSTTGWTWGHFMPCRIAILSVDRFVFYDASPASDGIKLFQFDPGATIGSASWCGVNWFS
ncbi:MAG: hypothetical protein JWO16_1794, partial [Sphingomonas bacterium]|nr:hypothetical protein [Sphingomonas bacterium]